MVSIRVLSTETEKAYNDLVSKASMGMLYHSIKYRNFLREILERPERERAFLILVVGYPGEEVEVPDIRKKELSEFTSFYS